MIAIVDVNLSVNDVAVRCSAAPRDMLADFLRQTLELTGMHTGCEMGACGACLVLVDDRVVHSCLMFAVQADGVTAETMEGLSDRPVLAKAVGKLTGVAVSPELLDEATAALSAELGPHEDQQANPAMRRHLARVLLSRCVAALSNRPDLHIGGTV